MNKLHYGIEFEFFVKKDSSVVPAYLATNNLDGNPVVGELKTKIHSSITDCVFELQKLIYLEQTALFKKGYLMTVDTTAYLTDEQLREMRKDKKAIDYKKLEILEEFTIYNNNKLGKILPKNIFKSSLQVNVSDNQEFSYPVYKRIQIDTEYKYETNHEVKSYGGIFNYPVIIAKLDKSFKDEIALSSRVPGVYAIKNGDLGKRIEYRSLPSNIDLIKLIQTLND